MVAIDDGADGIAAIAQQVPPVRHLDSLRYTLTNTICVSTGATARDHLDARMLTKPDGERLRLLVRK